LADDPDDTLSLLVDMAAATDETLRSLATRLAGRVLVEVARHGVVRQRGVGRLRSVRGRAEGDLDLDESLDAIVAARAVGRAPNLDDLTTRSWERHDTAVCLVIDRSGSMSGARLATAAVAAAAVVIRYRGDAAVVAFSDEAIVVSGMDEQREPEDVVSDLLRLRGSGTTDLGLALRAATRQLARSTAGRRVVVVLSDCRSNTGGAAVDAAAELVEDAELAVIGPADDDEDAQEFATSVGARFATIAAPSGDPEALAVALAAG